MNKKLLLIAFVGIPVFLFNDNKQNKRKIKLISDIPIFAKQNYPGNNFEDNFIRSKFKTTKNLQKLPVKHLKYLAYLLSLSQDDINPNEYNRLRIYAQFNSSGDLSIISNIRI